MIAKIILLFLYIGNIGFVTAKNGEKKEGKYNIATTVASTVIMFLLYYFAFIK